MLITQNITRHTEKGDWARVDAIGPHNHPIHHAEEGYQSAQSGLGLYLHTNGLRPPRNDQRRGEPVAIANAATLEMGETWSHDAGSATPARIRREVERSGVTARRDGRFPSTTPPVARSAAPSGRANLNLPLPIAGSVFRGFRCRIHAEFGSLRPWSPFNTNDDQHHTTDTAGS